MPSDLDDSEREAGFAQVEAVRTAIRAYFNSKGTLPPGISLPHEKFQLFDRWFPEWVTAWNDQNPPHMQIPLEKNHRGDILFGYTPVRSRGVTVLDPKIAP